ncbi:MAG: type III-B CRISPR module-associated protein Cmr3 [Deltaproteobacteria bacterium]|nr:type III-B CRISPR module-associated protein Cmr3 [Deltaproteobacteria bacterium]
MIEYCFLHPLDVLFLRGNRLFDGAGDHAEALMPPWPSLAAGALRSRMLVDHGFDPARFAKDEKPDGPLGDSLGTPKEPGHFRISAFFVACREDEKTTPFFPLPSDVVALSRETLAYLRPAVLHPALRSSGPLPACPVLATATSAKPVGGLWLNSAGLAAYLKGAPLNTNEHCVERKTLWEYDPRLGIALEPASRAAAEGKIYTTETVAMAENHGFLVGVQGAAGLLPKSGLARLGGDGRGAEIHPCKFSPPAPDWERIAQEKRFRLLLTTPGIFPDGWRTPGLNNENGALVWGTAAFSAALKAACVNRGEIVSGWDLAERCPKKAQRTAPTGSVYYFDDFCGDIEALKRLPIDGLWATSEAADKSRKAEGFNNVMIAAWPLND